MLADDKNNLAFLFGLMEGALTHIAYEFARTDRGSAVATLQAARTAIEKQVADAEASGRIDPRGAETIAAELERVLDRARAKVEQALH